MVEELGDTFDICLALHACGNATDYALIKAVENRAAYIVSPCCVGEDVKKSTNLFCISTQLKLAINKELPVVPMTL